MLSRKENNNVQCSCLSIMTTPVMLELLEHYNHENVVGHGINGRPAGTLHFVWSWHLLLIQGMCIPGFHARSYIQRLRPSYMRRDSDVETAIAHRVVWCCPGACCFGSYRHDTPHTVVFTVLLVPWHPIISAALVSFSSPFLAGSLLPNGLPCGIISGRSIGATKPPE